MRRAFALALSSWLCVLQCAPVASCGALDELRAEVTSDDDDDPPSESKRHHHCDDGLGSALLEPFGDLLGAGVAVAAVAPFWFTAALLDDDYSRDAAFPPYPYAGGYPGYADLGNYLPTVDGTKSSGPIIQVSDDEEIAADTAETTFELPLCEERRGWSGRASVEYGHDFDDLERIGGRLLLTTTSRFGISTAWSHFNEAQRDRRTDHLTIGDVNLLFRFAQSERAEIHAGLGARVLADHGADAGFNFTVISQFYPVKPVVLSGLFDAGTIGDAGLFHGRVSAGVVIRQIELFGGYDFWRIDRVRLRGPMAGLRIWF